jgi:MarR family 2-MHQ and catechol resistance regulon transcriptional repressor
MDMKEFNNFMPIKFLIVLGKMHSSVFAKVERQIKDLGLNTTEFLILYAIASNGALTIQDIAARIFVTSGNMTYTIDKLEKRAIIKRIRNDKDRRRIFIDFTQNGEDLWKNIMDEHIQFMKENFEGLDDDLIFNTIENMKRIGKALDEK